MLRSLFALLFVPAHVMAEAGAPTPVPELHCVVMPSAVVDVASGVNGRVETIYAERGDAVQAGQVVAALESGVEQANLALAKARAELETDIHLRKARLAFEERKLQRTDKLRTNRVVSVHEKDEAETQAKMAHWQLRQAIDDKYLASLELVRAAEALKRRSVQSPIDGVVVDRFKWPGEYVEDEPILRVARLDPLWIEVVAPVAMHGDVRKNLLAEVMTEIEGSERLEARVIVIDPMGDAASGTFRVRLELPNPDLSILGGTKCKARFPRPARYAPEVPDLPAAVERKQIIEPARVPDDAPVQKAFSAEARPASAAHADDDWIEESADSYIVLTPSLGSDAERRRLAAELRRSGIDDFLEMGHGPYAGRISVGVYKPLRMAEQRKKQLEALGFAAVVLPRDPGRPRLQSYTGSLGARAQPDVEAQQREAALVRGAAGHYDERG